MRELLFNLFDLSNTFKIIVLNKKMKHESIHFIDNLFWNLEQKWFKMIVKMFEAHRISQ
jgi:hypothetical protein